MSFLFPCRILCYNAGLEDQSKLGEPEREYIDEMLGRIYAIEYSPKGMHRLTHISEHLRNVQQTGSTVHYCRFM